MKIGIDARMYGVEATTGIGAYIKNLTDQLFLIDEKNEYFLFMLEPAFSQFQPPNNRIKKILVKSHWYTLREQIELPMILLKSKLDLVHFPHFNVPLFYPKNFIVTIHDITPKFFPGPKAKKSLIRRLGYQLIFKSGIKRAKKIIVNSNHTKQNLIKHFKIQENKINVTYLGVDEQFKVIEDKSLIDNIKNKYKISKPFIFYIGVWRDHKNLPNLVKAFNLIKESYGIDCQLVLAGKPDSNYPEIQEEINNSKFRFDIINPGFIEQKELILFYNAAELFVLPSFCEGFGLVALESLACGTPVIASNSTSLPEILGKSSLYFDPNQPSQIAQLINSILTDQNLYQNLKNLGLNQIKKYNWRECSTKTLNVYESS